MSGVMFDKRAVYQLPFWRVLPAVAGIYTAQSIVGGLTFQGIPAILRANGVALDMVGLVSVAMLPWALKFLWSPSVERYRLPSDGRRRSRWIVIAGEAIVALTLIALAATSPSAHPPLFILLGMVALASATVDIACDAFTIEQLPPENRGWGNTAQVGGGYFGIVFGSGIFLIIAASAGWTYAVLAMAALIVFLTLPFATTAEPARPRNADLTHRPSLRFAWRRPEIRYGLLLTVLFEIGVRLVQGMTGPFLIDAGIDLAVLGLLNGFGGAAAGVIGTLVGGALVRFFGPNHGLIIGASLQALTVIAFACAAALGVKGQVVLVVLLVLQTVSMAIGFVTLYSVLMGLSSLRQAGVDFTLFQCADAAVAGVCGFGGGVIAQSLGYGGCFGLAALAAVTAIAVVPIILRRLSCDAKRSSI